MQRMVRLIGVVLIMALFAPTAGAQQPERSYVLLGRSNRLPANLEQVVAARGGAVAYTVPEIGLAVLMSTNSDFQAQMETIADVEAVAPDIQLNYDLPGFQPITAPEIVPPFPYDDPYYMFQWNLDAIDAPEAWAQGATGAGVRIAIIDDGIYAEHPDLTTNLNRALSKSFIPGDTEPFTPWDIPSHASYVAGVVAAADNNIGIIGVAPQAEIVGVRVVRWDYSTSDGFVSEGKFAWMAAGIVYAANIGSDIINISLGGWVDQNGNCNNNNRGDCLTARDVKKVMNLLNRATSYAHDKGSIVIAAAGNDGVNTDSYDWQNRRYFLPAQSNNVIAVSATGPYNWLSAWLSGTPTDLDIFTSYSNHGKSLVDFAAPGGNTAFFYEHPECIFPFGGYDITCGVFDSVIGPDPAFGWNWASGTSAAAPHVSGVAALIIGKNGGQMDPDKVEQILIAGADDRGAPGKDALFGYGRVNAAASLHAMDVAATERPHRYEEPYKHWKPWQHGRSAIDSCTEATSDCLETDGNVLFLALINN